MPRYIVIGAGAIGVTFAAELNRSGHAVALIARGAQLEAARTDGITYVRPHGETVFGGAVHGGPEELTVTADDVLILATKTQDAEAALAAWAVQPAVHADGSLSTVGAVVPVVTTQNGIEAERAALRHFATVFGAVLALPASYVKPGVVVAPAVPVLGRVWLGAFPDRAEPRAEAIARDLRRANFDTEVVDEITRYKNAKLCVSVTFAVDAIFEPSPLRDRLAALTRAEAEQVLTAAGGELADLSSASQGFRIEPTAGEHYRGNSIWQSITRTGTLETDFINGEIVLQARLQGREAPVNGTLVDRSHRLQQEHGDARSLGDAEILALFPQLDPAGTVPAELDVALAEPVGAAPNHPLHP